MQLPQSASPFLLLVHHVHAFSPIDPVRYFQRQFILPEGFPAHPHRGFITLTIMLEGAFRHRDSMGVYQEYGENCEAHSQWLVTGSGLLHEEMFDTSLAKQELYQLWINLPSTEKMCEPRSFLLGPKEAPIVIEDGGTITVYAGSYKGNEAMVPTASPLSVYRIELQPNAQVTFECPYETCLLYIRNGGLTRPTDAPAHTLSTMESVRGTVNLTANSGGADILVLAGEPLREPVAMQGSMVMNTYDEINQAYVDYQAGLFGRPWDHKVSNEEWRALTKKNRNILTKI